MASDPAPDSVGRLPKINGNSIQITERIDADNICQGLDGVPPILEICGQIASERISALRGVYAACSIPDFVI